MLLLRLAFRLSLPLLLAGSIYAQGYPGQYPGQTIPIPRDPRIPGTQSPGGIGRQRGAKIVHAGGVIYKVSARSFSIADPQTNKTVSFQFSTQTRFTRDGKQVAAGELKVGDRVRIDAEQDRNGWLNATAVEILPGDDETGPAPRTSKPVPSEEKTPAESKADRSAESAPASKQVEPEGGKQTETEAARPVMDPNVERIETGAKKTPPPDSGDDAPPTLRRGVPPKTPAAKPRPAAQTRPVQTAEASERPSLSGNTPRAAAPPPLDPHMAFIETAREAILNYSEKLPNFVCTQITTRYLSRNSGRNWDPEDVFSADVFVEDGKESYKNIKVGGKPVNKTMDQLGGQWSNGEFTTMTYNIFAPYTAARFVYKKDEMQGRLMSAVYDFQIDKAHSNWQIHRDSSTVVPAYRGTVWIDKESARVLRLETQAELPESFPSDTTELTLDYEFVLLGGQKYLLPVRSENLSCQRSSSFCARNTIDFRNYHKYTGESKISFGDSDKPPDKIKP